MNEKKELAQLIKDTLKMNGFEGWTTGATCHVRTNATMKQTRAIFAEVEYPQHLIVWNTAYSKGGCGSFKVMIRTS